MLTDVTDFANMQIFIWSGGQEGVECTPMLFIDNIRIADL